MKRKFQVKKGSATRDVKLANDYCWEGLQRSIKEEAAYSSGMRRKGKKVDTEGGRTYTLCSVNRERGAESQGERGRMRTSHWTEQ